MARIWSLWNSRGWLLVAGLLCLAFCHAFTPATAAAKPVAVGSLGFSDELGGFRILGVSGSGSLVDPFVVVEEIFGPTDAVLIIRGLSTEFGNRIGTLHLAGFAIRKVVINATDSDWNLFEIELRETRGAHSPRSDGLSFGQGSEAGRPFTSDALATAVVTDEPYDSVAFRDGTVRPGEWASFSFVVTDTWPVSPIYLLQQPTLVVAAVPPARPSPQVACVMRGEPSCRIISRRTWMRGRPTKLLNARCIGKGT
jgi:hypothetical protein